MHMHTQTHAHTCTCCFSCACVWPDVPTDVLEHWFAHVSFVAARKHAPKFTAALLLRLEKRYAGSSATAVAAARAAIQKPGARRSAAAASLTNPRPAANTPAPASAMTEVDKAERSATAAIDPAPSETLSPKRAKRGSPLQAAELDSAWGLPPGIPSTTAPVPSNVPARTWRSCSSDAWSSVPLGMLPGFVVPQLEVTACRESLSVPGAHAVSS